MESQTNREKTGVDNGTEFTSPRQGTVTCVELPTASLWCMPWKVVKVLQEIQRFMKENYLPIYMVFHGQCCINLSRSLKSGAMTKFIIFIAKKCLPSNYASSLVSGSYEREVSPLHFISLTLLLVLYFLNISTFFLDWHWDIKNTHIKIPKTR
jgi:hypothetical protein